MLRMTSIFSLFREAKVDVNINGIISHSQYFQTICFSLFILCFITVKLFASPGYIIPKGWKVLVWYGAVHMDSEIYENPQNFNPSRWNVSTIILYYYYYYSVLFFFFFLYFPFYF